MLQGLPHRAIRSRNRMMVACILSMGLAGCGEDNGYVAPPPVKVTVATPVSASVPLYAEFTGNTAASATVDLEARVEGYLAAINYADGEAVRAGRVLFEIEKNQYQAQVEQQQALLESKKATAANARRDYDRQAELGQRQVASQSTVDLATTTLATANADVAATQATLKLAETSLAYATIAAPFDGVVTRHLVDVGALVGSSGPTRLATILQVNPIFVYFQISEQQQIALRDALASAGQSLKSLREEKRAMPVEIVLSSGSSDIYRGQIDYIAPQVDAQTGTLEMRAKVKNADIALVPGLFVRVRLPVGRMENALLVNDTAILSNQAGSYVKVVGADDVVVQKAVTTGPVEGPLRVITAGLSAEDRVVIGAIQRAVSGNPVTPSNGAMDTLPDARILSPDSAGNSAEPAR